jgi:hypothetical protein
MADLRVEGADIVVRLNALEAVAACRREVRVPITGLRMVHVDEAPLATLSRWRLPGLCWPGAFAIGSCRRRGRREFAVVWAHKPAVVLDAEGTAWDRLVISRPDAVDVASQLAALLLGRGPGKPGARGAFPASLD